MDLGPVLGVFLALTAGFLVFGAWKLRRRSTILPRGSGTERVDGEGRYQNSPEGSRDSPSPND